MFLKKLKYVPLQLQTAQPARDDWLSYIGFSWIKPFYLYQNFIHPDFCEPYFSETDLSEQEHSRKLYIQLNKAKPDFGEYSQ